MVTLCYKMRTTKSKLVKCSYCEINLTPDEFHIQKHVCILCDKHLAKLTLKKSKQNNKITIKPKKQLIVHFE